MIFPSPLHLFNDPPAADALSMDDASTVHAAATAAYSAAARGKRDAMRDAMEQVPGQPRRPPPEDPKRPWVPMVPVLNQAHWKRVTSVLMKYADGGQPGEYRAEACRRIEKAMTEPGLARKLDLSNLGLREVPPLLPDVAELDMTGNRLTSLPPLPCTIRKLFLAHNLLKTLPAVLPPALRVLNVAYNDLSAWPETLPDSVEFLYIQGNAVPAVPVNVPRALRTVDICNNRGPDLVFAAAEMLINLNRERALLNPMGDLLDRGRKIQAARRCAQAMEQARSSLRER